MAMDIGAYIDGRITKAGKSHADVGKELGMTQQNVSYKIRKNAFSYHDLLIIFKFLEMEDGEILKLMKAY